MKDFFSDMFTGKAKSPFTCEEAEEIFFGCNGNRLQSVSQPNPWTNYHYVPNVKKIYSALASDENFEYIGISQGLNRLKENIAKGAFGKKAFNTLKGANGKIKASTPWVGTKEIVSDLKTIGAMGKFRTKMEMLGQMAMACDLIFNEDINTYMQQTNRRLYNKMSVLPLDSPPIYMNLTQVLLGFFWTIGSRKICRVVTLIQQRSNSPLSSRPS